ncbi:3-deoxy-D-manno-octulosonic acid transferase [Entomobacter blattae]|uniref:3-deoxy-D-manno-octulosonic acid transferase n=1 Tax=Entomobacter blattae TaxID=2762277 RepID=A0A7H1NQI0_9PROT|nr:3-deoxy-D-manno-octulosonic acid transferase [Entomobacter blattae]QNT78040.1 3-deoxy-D-manno-octulosonic acid transferase [Entomobacter blattae]
MIFAVNSPFHPDKLRQDYPHQDRPMPSSKTANPPTPLWKLWNQATAWLALPLKGYLYYRCSQKKEDPTRLNERFGRTTLSRPRGTLLWFHAASVGEMLSLLPLLESLNNQRPELYFLLTTGTLTAANLLRKRIATSPLKTCLIHQFIPLDVPQWIERFLAHWQPQLALLTESELWPNLIAGCQNHSIPLILLNGRLSERSFRRWRKLPFLITPILQNFAWIAARSKEDGHRFQQLGGPIDLIGDLKEAAPPLPYNEDVLESIRRHLHGRQLWIASSTHEGEEEVIIAAHRRLLQFFPALLCLIIPRHPHRGEAIAALADQAPQYSKNALPTPSDPFWIGDTLGDMGVFYRLSEIVFLGNSLPCMAPKGGGHNPLEPIRLHSALACGPEMKNFAEIIKELQEDITIVYNDETLASWVLTMLNNPVLREKRSLSAFHYATSLQGKALEELSSRILSSLSSL